MAQNYKIRATIRFNSEKVQDITFYSSQNNINAALAWADAQISTLAGNNQYWLKVMEPIPDGENYQE